MSVKCVICGEINLVPIRKRMESTEVYDSLGECLDCGCVLNTKSLSKCGTTEEINQKGSDFYIKDKFDFDTYTKSLESFSNLLSNITNPQSGYTKYDHFVDFGCGTGALGMCALSHYKKVSFVDHDLRGMNFILENWSGDLTFNEIQKINVHDSIDKIEGQVDMVAMWHVLEHICNPLEVLSEIKDKLSDSGGVCAQVPGFKDEYVEDAHYVFYNPDSLKKLFTKAGFREVKYAWDRENHFYTAFALK